jgi:hypothetical protein
VDRLDQDCAVSKFSIIGTETSGSATKRYIT